MRRMIPVGLPLVMAAVALFMVAQGRAQAPLLLLKQDRDGAPAQNLTAAEAATLSDPFFELVLREHADVTLLPALEDLIQSDPSQRATFVVDEDIADPRREVAQQPQTRRTVLAYTGQSSQGHVLDSNVMLSLFFASTVFSNAPDAIEAWGWDNHRGRYNYYKLDRTGTPDGRATWKFRGSSEGADLLNASDRQGTCLACHVNGAPVMKELLFPWNNWHSVASQSTTTRYLTPAASVAERWPVISDPRLAASRLKGAETLERSLLPAITQFNVRRVMRSLARNDADGNIAVGADGLARVVEGRRLLRPLFVTTEYNIVSARQRSGLHPLPAPSGTGPGQPVAVPASFFLNASLISGGTPAGYLGLGLQQAQDFGSLLRIDPEPYRRLVIDSNVRLAGQRPADTDFAWFVPEPSHVDIDLVDRMIRTGMLTREFVAAVVAVDLERPVLSARREALFRFMPTAFRFKLLVSDADVAQPRHPDELARTVVAAIESTNPAAGSAEAQFLMLLKDPNPLQRLGEQMDAYRQRVSQALGNPATRDAELQRLYGLMLERRRAVLLDPVLRTLNETGDRLFPLP
jgi:hypothetical protein